MAPTGSVPAQVLMLTGLYQTMEAAEATPLPPRVFWTATPDLASPSTPDYSAIPHLWTDAGVIVDGPPDTFANCFKMVDQIDGVPAPWVENMWFKTAGPDDPKLAVYAGSYVNPDEQWPNYPQGAVFVVHLPGDPCVLEPHRAPFADGPLEIIAARGTELLLRSANHGRIIAFDATRAQYLTAMSTPTPGPSPAPMPPATFPTSAMDFVVLAQEAASFGPNASIPSGVIGLGLHKIPNRGRLEIGVGSYIGPYAIIAADEILVGQNGLVTGTLVFNRLTLRPNSNVVGPQVTPLGLQVNPPLFPPFDVPPGAPAVTIAAGARETLSPGEYSTVTVGPKAAVRLADGTYEVIALRIEQGASVECPGICEIRVVKSAYVGPRAELTAGIGLDQPSELSLLVAGTDGLRAHQGSRMDLIAYVPRGSIALGPDGVYAGTFICKRFSLLKGSSLTGPPQEQ